MTLTAVNIPTNSAQSARIPQAEFDLGMTALREGFWMFRGEDLAQAMMSDDRSFHAARRLVEAAAPRVATEEYPPAPVQIDTGLRDIITSVRLLEILHTNICPALPTCY